MTSPVGGLKLLNLTYPSAIAEDEIVKVGFGLTGNRLRVRFEVRSYEMTPNPDLSHEGPQWGLWDWDVVELFLGFKNSTRPGIPYYEFQVSPLGQHFELKIEEPRKITDRNFRSGFSYGAKILRDDPDDIAWEAWMEIPLEPLGWSGRPEDIVGGAFAILGKAERKRYWSLFLKPQEKPNFHLPEHFDLLILSGVR